MSIKTLRTREVYRNPWMSLREDEIERSNGARGIYGVVDKEDCAIIIPLDGYHVFLVEQFRYTIQRSCMELPQGGWEMAGVDAEELARGELREETGLRAEVMLYLGTMQIAYGFANQKQHVFLATGLTMGETDRDLEEHDLIVHRVSVAEFERMMLAGDIPDVCTLGAWALYKMWREHEG
jgi:8-oxo-dGTP pyrophosphatase MutT (NUDIX family)